MASYLLQSISMLVWCKILLQKCATASKDFPEPVVFLPLNKEYGTRDISKNYLTTTANGIALAPGPDGQADGSYEFPGNANGYIEIPKSRKTDTRHKISFFTWIFYKGTYGPILNYETDDITWGLHIFTDVNKANTFFVCFVSRSDMTRCRYNLEYTIHKDAWNFAGFSYDSTARKMKLYVNGVVTEKTATETFELHTEPKIRIGGTKNIVHSSNKGFAGRLSCFQIYDTALTEEQIKKIQQYCDRNDIFKPCFDYKLLDINNRLLNQTFTQGTKTDKAKVSRIHWHRLAGKRIISYCPNSHGSCGKQPPGWINGQYPRLEDGIKTMELCYRKDSDCCAFKVSVLIRIGGTKNIVHSSNKGFAGRLSCFQIYDTALTEEQIKKIQQYCDRNDIFKPCFDYKLLDINNRLLNQTFTQGTKTDKAKVSRIHWHRLAGKRIISYCPNSHGSCGKQPPGWINGQYPRLEDGIKTMELCYRKDSDCCAFKVSVLVRQCYGYYVFKFDDFPVEGRFCVEQDKSTFHNAMFLSTNERCLTDHAFYMGNDVNEASKCVSYCLNAGSRCKSVNYIKEGSGRCQLNNATKAEGHLREDPKCSYYEKYSSNEFSEYLLKPQF
ncbi:uncharacterized protein LOC110242446 [Exaiptasia diaphana]|uniref:Apple domain-containing protein n=1 Tax=Exaiptasia diaphana TaxID=2652724 RepID=A0A913YKD4_EXADI|nr:uncharacterized protein LOC110242446 [Exaiptasia diaphana]